MIGSIKIETLDRSISRIETNLDEIQHFLQLPQHRLLGDLLQEIKFDYHGNTID